MNRELRDKRQREYADEKHGYRYIPVERDGAFRTSDGLVYLRDRASNTIRRGIRKVRGKAARKADKAARRPRVGVRHAEVGAPGAAASPAVNPSRPVNRPTMGGS